MGGYVVFWGRRRSGLGARGVRVRVRVRVLALAGGKAP